MDDPTIIVEDIHKIPYTSVERVWCNHNNCNVLVHIVRLKQSFVCHVSED